jgi:hypothetical protein
LAELFLDIDGEEAGVFFLEDRLELTGVLQLDTL